MLLMRLHLLNNFMSNEATKQRDSDGWVTLGSSCYLFGALCGGRDKESGCPGAFQCAGRNGACINAGKVCDGSMDCPSGEDETNCPPSRHMGMTPCLDRKSCERSCDGKHDCPDLSDEIFCPAECRCGEGFYMCEEEKKCIPVDKVCNNESDCMIGDDEAKCQRMSYG
ncbi:PGBM-like protein [Mya arenaria]|uniref:PGBM-like protein n=1 Tax=Mya arenaria TaxID=6604 RepID=A0ABY7EVK3_MYAAR|nr:PGBM-like protein [Mya arenaria]